MPPPQDQASKPKVIFKQRHSYNTREYVVHEQVWLVTKRTLHPPNLVSAEGKLSTFWTGPWKIATKVHPLWYVIEPSALLLRWDPTACRTFMDADRLKPYYKGSGTYRNVLVDTTTRIRSREPQKSAKTIAKRQMGSEPRPGALKELGRFVTSTEEAKRLRDMFQGGSLTLGPDAVSTVTSRRTYVNKRKLTAPTLSGTSTHMASPSAPQPRTKIPTLPKLTPRPKGYAHMAVHDYTLGRVIRAHMDVHGNTPGRDIRPPPTLPLLSNGQFRPILPGPAPIPPVIFTPEAVTYLQSSGPNIQVPILKRLQECTTPTECSYLHPHRMTSFMDTLDGIMNTL
jgi:hypothetical protein